MFCNEVTSTRVQTTSKKAGQEQIYERPKTEEADEDVIEHELCRDVDHMPLGNAVRSHEARPESVEEDLECPATRVSPISALETRARTRRTPCQARCSVRPFRGAWVDQYRHHLRLVACDAPDGTSDHTVNHV